MEAQSKLADGSGPDRLQGREVSDGRRRVVFCMLENVGRAKMSFGEMNGCKTFFGSQSRLRFLRCRLRMCISVSE